MKYLTTPLTALLLAAAFAPVAGAQCFVPDNLDGPCCTPTTPDLLPFPGINAFPVQLDCWDSCGIPTVNCGEVFTSPLIPTGKCGEFEMQLSVFDCAGTPLMSGLMTLVYMRTWSEEPAPFVREQVWRFHAKVDLERNPAVPPGCPIPDSMVGTNRAFYYGYLDYAFECVTAVWQNALVLFHNCDAFVHDPAYSSVPGVFDPSETHAIIGPDTVANPFVPSPLPIQAAAPLVGEAVRATPSASPLICMNEEPLAGGSWIPLIEGCFCPLAFAPTQNAALLLDGTSACGSSFQTLNFWPLVPWFGLTTTSLGSWSTTATYPGEEGARVAEGAFLNQDGCSTDLSIDIMYGSITTDGFPVISTPPLPQTFIDLASNYSTPFPGPIGLPLFGEVAETERVIYVNR